MRHVGGVSSFGPQAGAAAAAAAPSPGCFALMSQVDSLNREEQYDEEACSGISDLSPCPNATAAAAVAGCAGWEPETWLVPMDAGAASNATGSGSSGGADSEAAEE